MSETWSKFLNTARLRYPTNFDLASKHLSENLVADCELELPTSVKIEAQEIVKAIFSLRMSSKYIELIGAPKFTPKNFSVLMSYDFHYVDNQLKLIEVNTNASSSLIAELLYLSRNLANPFCKDFSEEILATFKNEFSLVHNRPLKNIWILDENPTGQRLFAEFLMYQELFQRAGINAKIIDLNHLPSEILCDLIYNRSTDFYFETPNSKPLREAFESNKVVFSPNPAEYHLLANKKRLIDIYTNLDSLELAPETRKLIKEAVLKCKIISSQNEMAELWADRKSYFFKPLTSFGGKAVYRGQSITKKVFDDFFADKNLGKYMAQEFKPAPEREFTTSQGKKRFKFDLRFYAYQDQIQIAVGRLYQGQTTNLHTLGGCLAPIIFT